MFQKSFEEIGISPDALSRPLTRTIGSDATYQFDYAYNGIGQLDTLTYPTSTAGVRFKAKYGYTAGYLTSVQEFTGNVNGTVLWNLNLLDARLNAISETYGNGLWLQNGFDAATGEPLTRQSGTGGQAANVQNLSYVWDDAGNLTSRQDLRQAFTESFTYDALDRLTLASGPGAQSTSIGYDAIGNITSKTGVGTYTYHATRKHAVVSAGGSSYSYDGNGNLTSRSGATVTWSSYNLPTYLADPSGYSAQFWYAPDRSRWKQVSSYAGATETTIYVGGLLEKFTNATATHWKHLIPTPSGQVQVIRRSSGVNDTLYVTTDHLGSTDAVLNAAGAVLMAGSFDVHGKRRASNWQGVPSTAEWQAIAATTRRGYTGHEQLDNVMLIHMNGRVFDPVIGRFTSADPFVDCWGSTQGWNRYSYVKGRLLRATDPSGFSLEEIIVNGKRIPKEPVDNVSNGRPYTEPGVPGGSGGGGGGGGGREGKNSDDKKKQCNVCIQQYMPAIGAAVGATLASQAALNSKNVYAGAAIIFVGAIGGAAVGASPSAGADLASAAVTYMGGHTVELLSQGASGGHAGGRGIFVNPIYGVAGEFVGSRFENPSIGVGIGTTATGLLENIGAISRAIASNNGAVATRLLTRIGATGMLAAAVFDAGLSLAKNACKEQCAP